MLRAIKRSIEMGFPERIKRMREERKLSYKELADMIQVHTTHLRRYEKGGSQPTLDVLKKLCVALNVSGNELLFDADEQQPPEDFIVQFENLEQLTDEDKKSVKTIIDALYLRHHARKLEKG